MRSSDVTDGGETVIQRLINTQRYLGINDLIQAKA